MRLSSFPAAAAVILILGAYLLGSIPWGLIFTRLFTQQDIRQKGSGNIGATNVRRTAGSLPALLTLTGDILKGAAPVYLAGQLPFSEAFPPDTIPLLAALSAFLGHLYPFFLGFKDGGKGVATAAGCFLILCPLAVLISVIIFLTAACWSNHASVGSMAAMLILPAAVRFGGGALTMVILAAVVSVFVIERHRDNINRLRNGTEALIWERRK